MENKPILPEHVAKVIAMFKSDSELEADEIFRDKLQKILSEIQYRPAAPDGKRYVRGAWDYFVENSITQLHIWEIKFNK